MMLSQESDTKAIMPLRMAAELCPESLPQHLPYFLRKGQGADERFLSVLANL